MMFLLLLSGDGDGFILSVIEILFPILVGLKQPKEDDDEELEALRSEQADDERTSTIIGLVMIPVLLLLQFYMALVDQDSPRVYDPSVVLLDQTVIFWTVLLYVIVAYLYRQACLDQDIRSNIIVLLPEIGMNVVLVLVLVRQAALGFITLLMFLLYLSLFVAASCATELFYRVGGGSRNDAKLLVDYYYDGDDEQEERAGTQMAQVV